MLLNPTHAIAYLQFVTTHFHYEACCLVTSLPTPASCPLVTYGHSLPHTNPETREGPGGPLRQAAGEGEARGSPKAACQAQAGHC